MLAATSPYARAAASLRDNGYHVIPVGPGTKIPGAWSQADGWRPMPSWAKFCDTMPPEFSHDQWERWPDAGLCLPHGAVIGLDLDTDRPDVSAALHKAVTPPTVRRRGQKGWLGYYRPGAGLDGLTRIRWFDPKVVSADGKPSKSPVVELLLHGTQSVLPPSIHPGTGEPYIWTTPDTLENTSLDELPVFGADDLAALDREFAAIGLTRQTPRHEGLDQPRAVSTGHDLEKPFWRSLNDRALEADALAQWWPAMGLPKTRMRGHSAWEAVPVWRGSGSGRAAHDRNPNLKASPKGIMDFGADRAFTPVDVVMAWRDCAAAAAGEWLSQFVRPETIPDMSQASVPDVPADDPINDPLRPIWQAMPAFMGERRKAEGEARPRINRAEYKAHIPDDAGPFPIQSYRSMPGLLGVLCDYLDSASATQTEAGALSVALPLLGAIMGRAYASPTDLRTNVYTVALGGSGTGKTSLVNPAKELLRLAKCEHVLGQDRIASGAGLLSMLTSGQPKISFLDEFGHMLKQMGSPGAGIHVKQIITEFTGLYSAANTLFTGTAYSERPANQIDCPHLCLFGMATPDQFWDAFGSGAMEDGQIARYLVFPIGASSPKEPDKSGRADVAEAMEGIMTAISGRVRGNLGMSPVYAVPMHAEADRARAGLVATMDAAAAFAEETGVKGGASILRRVAENAIKIAMISAVGRDPSSPVISAEDFNIGHALARWSAVTMINNVASRIADNQTERDVNTVERKVRDAGPEGILMGVMKDKLRGIKGRDIQEIVDRLEEAGVIVKDRVQSTRPGWRLVHRGHILEKR